MKIKNTNFFKILISIALILVIITACQFENIKLPPSNQLPQEDIPVFTNKNVILGSPSFLTEGFDQDTTNYRIERDSYVLSYNNDLHRANWVAWHLEDADTGKGRYEGDFFIDEDLPYEWEKVGHKDLHFTDYGFDRGHMCPNADRNAEQDVPYLLDTYYMTNIIPQSQQNNQGPWRIMEEDIRADWIDNKTKSYEAYIVSGGTGIGGTSNKGYFEYIYSHSIDDNENPNDDDIKIAVPKFTWKVLIVMPFGEEDIDRLEDESTEVISFGVIMPNNTKCTKDWHEYIKSIDEIESYTGLDFFTELSEETQNRLESNINYIY